MQRLITLFLFFILSGTTVFAYTSPGKPTGHVTDFAGVLSQETKSQLESELRAFSAGENPEVVVATIQTLDGDPIDDYANALFREWGIGSKTKNNGVLFLVVTNDKKMRIEVGYGLEGALTDIESKHIQDDLVRPQFRANDFNGGIVTGVTSIKKALEGELVPVQKKRGPSARELETYLLLGIFAISWLASILGRSKSWWAGGVVGGVAGGATWLFTQWLFWIPIAAVVGLLFDYFVSKNYKEHLSNHHPAWWAGGGWGGWDRFGGGGGFGGFGGGSSGGGGSSSNW